MSNTALDYSASACESALEKIQQALIEGQELGADDIIQALAQDITNSIPICPVHFTRFVSQSELISRAELHVMINILGNGMTSQLTKDPDIFLSYAKAASICARRLG